MPNRHVLISRFGGPEVLTLATSAELPEPRRGEVRVRVEASGTGFTDTLIRRGRYPGLSRKPPFIPGYELAGRVEAVGIGVDPAWQGRRVLDLCVTGGYTQYAVRPVQYLVPIPDDVDAAEAVCLPLAYLTAYQMLTRIRPLERGALVLVIGASGTVGTALLDLARHLGLNAIGTASAKNLPILTRYGATAIDYRAGDFVEAVMRTAKAQYGSAGVDMAFDAIGGEHFARSYRTLKRGGMLVGYGAQNMGVGKESLFTAVRSILSLSIWDRFRFLYGGRRASFYSIADRRKAKPQEFKEDLAALVDLLRRRAIVPVVSERWPLDRARDAHERIDAGGFGGKIVLLPWS